MSLSKIKLAHNFKWDPKADIPENLEELKEFATYDERNSVVSLDNDFSNFEWYYNYLEMCVALSGLTFPKHRGSYLLNLGYVPVVVLPTCCASLEVNMMQRLTQMNLSYIKMPQYTFDLAFKFDLAGTDAWVSKLDIERELGIPLKEIRAVDVARRIYNV